MCIRVNVSFPTLNKFLMLYSLRSGTMLLMFWFAIRSFAFMIFAIIAIPELFTGGEKSFKKYLLTTEVTSPAKVQEIHYFVYGALITFLMAETILFVHSMYLANGLFCVLQLTYIGHVLVPVKNFLVSRLYTWVMEIGSMIVLCFIHKIILGWYLLMLMIFILELYSFGVVYSYYYCELLEESQRQKCYHAEWS